MKRHGTNTGYTNDGCRCLLCRRAHAKYQHAYKLRTEGRVDAPPAPRPDRHGTNTSYTKDACRCDLCRRAHAVYQLAYKRERKELPPDAEGLFPYFPSEPKGGRYHRRDDQEKETAKRFAAFRERHK